MPRPAAVLALVALGSTTPVAAQTGSVSGRVVQDDTAVFAIVSVHGDTSLAAITDSSGWFRIDGIPAGLQILLAEGIGFDPDVAFVTLLGGDSAVVQLEVATSVIPIDGSDYALPSPVLQRLATEALPQLLRDSVTASILGSPTDGGLLTAWAPWAEVDTILEISGRAVHVIGVCRACASSTSVTIEAGRQYTAAIPHVLLGLMRLGVTDQLLTLCMASVRPHETVFANCASAERRVTYVRRPDGIWIRLKVIWRHAKAEWEEGRWAKS